VGEIRFLGLVRFLLAFAVVGAHVGSLPYTVPLGSMLAVQAFYIISGFLIALVWDNKYKSQPNGLFLFYTNRAARIYFLYWAVLLIASVVAIVAKLLTRHWVGYFTYPPPHGLVLYELFTNLYIFGSAQAYWLGFNPGGALYYTMDYTSSPYSVWRTLTIGPAWTLELELTFYLLAPSLVNSRIRTIFAIIAASFAARFTWYAMGHDVDPWTYRFFPFEIGLFVLGIAAYRISKIVSWWPGQKLLYVIFALAVGSILGYDRLGLSQRSFVYLFIFAALIPYVFALTRSWKFDRFLADMSFPLYLAHWPVWLFCRDFLPVPWPEFPGLVPALASIVAAAGLVIYVERPIERWRQARIRSGRNTFISRGVVAPVMLQARADGIIE
jgi:peptidoglycan/LPS O-acetylase OafA/YrhL